MTSEQTSSVIALQQLAAQPTVSVRAIRMIAALNEAQDEMFRALASYLQQRGVPVAGSPFVRYHRFSFDDGITDLEVGVPVAVPVQGQGRVVPGELPGGPAISTWHAGGHDTLGEAYGRIQAGLAAHNRAPRGAGWEVYGWIEASSYDGAASWPAPTEWRTQLVQPVSEAETH